MTLLDIWFLKEIQQGAQGVCMLAQAAVQQWYNKA